MKIIALNIILFWSLVLSADNTNCQYSPSSYTMQKEGSIFGVEESLDPSEDRLWIPPIDKNKFPLPKEPSTFIEQYLGSVHTSIKRDFLHTKKGKENRSDDLCEQFNRLSDVILRLLLVLILMGFPLLISWLIDIIPDKIKKRNRAKRELRIQSFAREFPDVFKRWVSNKSIDSLSDTDVKEIAKKKRIDWESEQKAIEEELIINAKYSELAAEYPFAILYYYGIENEPNVETKRMIINDPLPKCDRIGEYMFRLIGSKAKDYNNLQVSQSEISTWRTYVKNCCRDYPQAFTALSEGRTINELDERELWALSTIGREVWGKIEEEKTCIRSGPIRRGLYLFFDVETNGLPESFSSPLFLVDKWPRIVQISWLVADKEGKILKEEDHIIKPIGFTITNESSRVHGISQSKALVCGEPIGDVLKKFISDSCEVDNIVGHNVKYDINVLKAECIRRGVEHPFGGKTVYCTMLGSTDYCRLGWNGRGYKWPKLTELYQYLFGEQFEDAHNSLADVIATYKCFFELRRNVSLKSYVEPINIIEHHKKGKESPYMERFRSPFYNVDKKLIKRVIVVDSEMGPTARFDMKNGRTIYFLFSDNATVSVGEELDINSLQIITLGRDGDPDITRLGVLNGTSSIMAGQ